MTFVFSDIESISNQINLIRFSDIEKDYLLEHSSSNHLSKIHSQLVSFEFVRQLNSPIVVDVLIIF